MFRLGCVHTGRRIGRLPESRICIAGRPGLILLHTRGKTCLFQDFQFDNSDIAWRPSGPSSKSWIRRLFSGLKAQSYFHPGLSYSIKPRNPFKKSFVIFQSGLIRILLQVMLLPLAARTSYRENEISRRLFEAPNEIFQVLHFFYKIVQFLGSSAQATVAF